MRCIYCNNLNVIKKKGRFTCMFKEQESFYCPDCDRYMLRMKEKKQNKEKDKQSSFSKSMMFLVV